MHEAGSCSKDFGLRGFEASKVVGLPFRMLGRSTLRCEGL